MSELMRERMGSVVNELIEADEQTAVVLADISVGYFREHCRNIRRG